MKRRQNHWYTVKEARALEFEARGFKIKQKQNGKWMVLCHPSQLMIAERETQIMDSGYDYAADDLAFDAAREDRVFGKR